MPSSPTSRVRRRPARTLLALLVAATAVALAWPLPPVEAQRRVIIRMATLVPDGSSWFLILKEAAEKWKELSGGRVVVRLYPGGGGGADPDVVGKMRLGTLSAGVLTAVGVGEVDKSVYALGIPLMYDSYDEVYWVLDQMRPQLEQSLLDKGFVVLNWADGGWVQFFTQKPVAVPDDLRALKLFSWAGDAEAVQVWRSAGFDPVALPSTEIATALQTGLIQALGSPPQVAVISQYFLHAPYMTDLRWQLLLGATLITRQDWERIPEDVRPALRQASKEAGARLRKDVRDEEPRDVEAMKKRGLTVVPVSAAQRAEWQKLTVSLYPRIKDHVVPGAAFDDALRLRDEYRRRKGGASGR
jgi:TRAP-type C4-dicarboxylate transport system substrate-binding protein